MSQKTSPAARSGLVVVGPCFVYGSVVLSLLAEPGWALVPRSPSGPPTVGAPIDPATTATTKEEAAA